MGRRRRNRHRKKKQKTKNNKGSIIKFSTYKELGPKKRTKEPVTEKVNIQFLFPFLGIDDDGSKADVSAKTVEASPFYYEDYYD